MSKPTQSDATPELGSAQKPETLPARRVFHAPTLREIVPGSAEHERIKTAFEALSIKR
jgi:hypothetical protein